MDLSALDPHSFAMQNGGGRISTRLSYAFGILFLSVGLIFLSLLTPLKAHAQTTASTSNAFVPVETTTPNGQDRHAYVQSTVIELLDAAICQLAGIDVINPQQGCLGINPLTHQLGYNPTNNQTPQLGGAIGLSTTMIGKLYTQPVSSAEYFQNLANNFGIPHAYAQQGTIGGYTALSPLLSLFRISRNLVYLFFLLAFILIGIGIMLRVKIDPRTVMSIQNMLPKIIIALILVTFSYAIAGLLVDSMWVMTFFGINTVSQAQPACGGQDTIHYLATINLMTNPIAYVKNLFSNGCFGSWNGLTGLSKNVGLTVGDILSRTILEVVGLSGDPGSCDVGIHFWFIDFGGHASAGDCAQRILFDFLKYLITILALLIVLIAILIALFKVWFTLLKSYIYVILDVITAPFWILAGLKPGSTLGFANWLRHIIAHLAVFPATAILFVVAAVIAANPDIQNPPPNKSFVPPLVGNTNIADNFGYLIAFGILLVAPQLLEMIRDALKSPKGKYAGPAISGGFGAGRAVFGGVVGAGASRAFRLGTSQYDPGPAREWLLAGGDSRFAKARQFVGRQFLGKAIKINSAYPHEASLGKAEGPH